MNIVGRFLLSSSVYHLRVSDDLGYKVIKNPDGSITVDGETVPGSGVEITWPDGTVGIPSVGSDGSWSDTSLPDQPKGPVSVSITLNLIEFEDGKFEQFADGSFVMPEFEVISNSIVIENGWFEITDDGQYIVFEVE